MTKKFTYEELKIPEPTTFDYANYANVIFKFFNYF